MADVIAIIESEHRNLARVLKVLDAIVERIGSAPRPGDIDRLFDVCHYVRVFPDKIHHPKEDRYIFDPLRTEVPEHSDLLDTVRDQHARCSSLTDQLYEAVKGYDSGKVSAAELKETVGDYLTFQFEHMRLEESEVLPLARTYLDRSLRESAGHAFASHGDPLFGANLESGFKALRERIVAAG